MGVLPLRRRGRALAALANDHSPVFRPLGRPAAVDVLLGAALAGGWSLQLPALTLGQGVERQLVACAQERGRLPLVQPTQTQPIVALRGSWEEYRAGLDRDWRKDVERRGRRLADALEPQVRVLEGPVDVARELERGFAAEAAGWKGRRGTSVSDDPAATRFYREVAESFAACGRLRLSAIEVAGEVIAFDYCLLDHGRVWILKGGFDERFRRFAPGLVLTFRQLERACELGLEAVELLGESVPWKLRLANDFRRQCFVGAYAPGSPAVAGYALRRGWPALRRAYRRVRRPR